MIGRSTIFTIVEEWLQNQDYFLVDVTVTPDNKIVVEIDHAEGVWIEDCVALSRFIESKLDREVVDFELEVGSAGIGQPFKVLKQYQIHIGSNVEVLTKEGEKFSGVLKSATEVDFVIEVEKKVRLKDERRPKLLKKEMTFTYEKIKYTKYLISFK